MNHSLNPAMHPSHTSLIKQFCELSFYFRVESINPVPQISIDIPFYMSAYFAWFIRLPYGTQTWLAGKSPMKGRL